MIFASLREFFIQFLAVLPRVLPILLVDWAITFVVLIYTILWLKKHIRPHVLHLDARIRAWARTLRYRDVIATGPGATERHARTWFFRFWTNFASSPSLLVLSFVVPIVAYYKAIQGHMGESFALHNWSAQRIYFLPGFGFAGAMLLSFVSKRIFKRLRPERPSGAFGHKLKDGSFPSGHSLTAIAFWTMFAVATVIFGAPLWVCVLVWLGAIATIVFTGLSRIYLGVHFPSDVLGGYAIGLIWSIVCYFTVRPVL